MLHASLSALLGSLFVLLAGANVWGMLHASRAARGHAIGARMIWAHRIGGYTFVLLFCAMCFFMASGSKVFRKSFHSASSSMSSWPYCSLRSFS